MKKYLLWLLLCWSGTAMAQMEAARKVTPEYLHETRINNHPPDIWQVIRDLPKVKDYSNGMISEVNIRTERGTQYRDLVFADGSKRTDEIQQVHETYKFFVVQISSPLPAGVTKAIVTALVESIPGSKGTSVVRWSIIMEGEKAAKKALTDSLTAEIANYEAGLKKLLE
ncbi:hypothetical protein [Chitinophaga sp.]|uniref:hypothetical protein n=1 Tax=Chitinophaga sp. TaxID=1869181 RepID=UPI00263238D0|nr:hypothetical protein [uncultured Chitinophaga sp.]